MPLPDPPQLAPGEKKIFYQADTTGSSWGTLIVFSRNTGDHKTRCWGEHYAPIIFHDRIGYDIQTFVNIRTPPARDVYIRMGIPEESHGLGLDAIPPPPKSGKPRCAYTTLILLTLLSSPRKCLLGYEIIAILKGRFRAFREATSVDWQTMVFNTLRRTAKNDFACLPAPHELSDAERVWYIDYTGSARPPSPPPYGHLYPQYREKKRGTHNSPGL